MDTLITFTNTEEVHRIKATDNKQVVYFEKTYALLESGIVVFRNGVYQIKDKDFFFINRKGQQIGSTDRFVIGVCFYKNGTTFQNLLQENDFIVFNFSVLSPRTIDYDLITNNITENYQRQIDGMQDDIFEIQQSNNNTISTVESISTNVNTTLNEYYGIISNHSTSIFGLQNTLDSISSTVETISSNLETINSDITLIKGSVQNLENRVQALETPSEETPVEPSEPNPEEPSPEEPVEQEP